jgi:hypothetical protein
VRVRRTAERASTRAAVGGGDGSEAEAAERPGKRERPAKDKDKDKGKTRETKALGPPKSVTLTQHRKAVVFAALAWLWFVLLFAGAFVKGLMYGDPTAAKANMANIVFGVLGLASWLFLWAHLKMGRYMAVASALVAVVVEGYFFFGGKENFGGLAGTALFLFTQFILLTGSGWFLRVFVSFLLLLVATAAFLAPHAVDVVLARGAVAQEARARGLAGGEWAYTKDAEGNFTQVRKLGPEGKGENDAVATRPQIWEELRLVAVRFDESEQTLVEWPKSIGLDLVGWGLDGLFLKPARREQVLVQKVLPCLYDALKAKDWGMRQWRVANEASGTPATAEENQAWDALATELTQRLLAGIGRFVGAEPSRGKALSGSYRVTARALPHRGATAPVEQVLQPSGTSRLVMFDEQWRTSAEAEANTTLEKLYIGSAAKSTFEKVRAELQWDANEAVQVFNCMQWLAAIEASIVRETLAEAGAGEEKPAGEGGETPAGEGGETPAGEGGEKPAGEGGDATPPGDEKPAGEGGGEEKPADGGGEGGGE